MKIAILAEGKEEDLDLLLSIAKRFEIKISRPDQKNFNSHKGLQPSLYKNAYLPWTKEEDERLEILYYARKKIDELSLLFQRNEGAIYSRIKKLGLEEKYGKKI